MKKIITILLSIVMVLSIAGCGSSEPEEATPASAEPAKEVTMTFKDNLTRLGQIKILEGELVTGYEEYEVKDGFEFLGWYETPSFLEASKKDLSVDTFSENTVLYGSWKSLVKTEDARVFYIVGEGSSPVLKASSWAGADVSYTDKEACKLQPTGNTNESVITMDLFKDDMFQLVSDWQWEGQYGFGKVSSSDDTQVMSGGGLSGEASKANILVLMDGNYTITLCTDVDSPALDEFTIVRNGDPVGGKAEEDAPFVPGEKTTAVMKGSWVADWSENIEMEATKDALVFSATKELEAGTELYFMVWDEGKDTGIGMNSSNVTEDSKFLLEESNNVKVKDAGIYTFIADVNNMTLQVMLVVE